MSHHHDHDHSHDHDHHHAHAEEMPFAEKVSRLLDHWIQHNDDHIATYREWAEKARSEGLEEVAAQMENAAETTAAVTEAFRRAKGSIPGPGAPPPAGPTAE
jgi:hypothetical protein